MSGDQVIVEAHPDIVSYLYEEEPAGLEDLERALDRRIVLRGREDCHREDFKVIGY